MPLLPYVPSIILTKTVSQVLQLCGKCDRQPCKELAVELCVFIYRDCPLDERKFILEKLARMIQRHGIHPQTICKLETVGS